MKNISVATCMRSFKFLLVISFFPTFLWGLGDGEWSLENTSFVSELFGKYYVSYLFCLCCLCMIIQIALVQHSILKELCSAPTVGKLRKDNGYMQMVVVHYLSLAWKIGLMTRISMI